MLSCSLAATLEREVVGQPRAIRTLVRPLTLGLSGLAPPAKPLGAYLFLGPTGTGKTHTANAVARVLHLESRAVARVDCAQLDPGHELLALGRRLLPHFVYAGPDDDSLRNMGPLSVVLLERLEALRPEIVPSLIGALETGSLSLPEGRIGSLQGCLILITSGACSREIYGADRQEIGFAGAAEDLEESEKARIFQMCCTEVEKRWGAELLGHMDDLIVFHGLQERHLAPILRRMAAELERSLAAHDVGCELTPEAEKFLVERSAGFLRHGAWFLEKVFRRYVLFPAADLVASGRLTRGSRIRVECGAVEALRFRIAPADGTTLLPGEDDPASIDVHWVEPARSG